MPFIQMLVHPETLSRDTLIAIRDATRACVADVLTEFDPEHLVLESMVDLTVRFVGPLDVVEPAMYVTVLARDEPARSRHSATIVAKIEAVAVDAGAPAGSMVELILTNRTSVYAYEQGA